MKKIYLIIAILILCITTCNARDLNAVRYDDVTILYDEGLEKAAVSAAEIYPDIKKSLEKILRWKIDFKPDIYLVKDHERFQRMAGHPLVVGYAVPDKMLIVIDYSKALTDPFSVSSILKHELCHLLLHKNINKNNLPKWLDEGVAQWASGGLADILTKDSHLIDRAIITGRYIPFKYISQIFPGDDESLMLAYAQSKSLVEYIVSEFKPDGIYKLLNSLRIGRDIESALQETFMIAFDELEKNWYSAMNKKALWVTALISHLYEIVFFLGAVSLIIAYVKIVIRKRAQKDDEDDDNDLRAHFQ